MTWASDEHTTLERSTLDQYERFFNASQTHIETQNPTVDDDEERNHHEQPSGPNTLAQEAGITISDNDSPRNVRIPLPASNTTPITQEAGITISDNENPQHNTNASRNNGPRNMPDTAHDN